MKHRILGFFIVVIFSTLLFFVGMDTRIAGDPVEVYQVYLYGEKLGLIKSKNDLLNLIDTEQTEIKDKYKVDKVYPPSGLDIKKVYTYDNDIKKTTEIYNKIKDIEPFTIQGYTATITYTEDRQMNDGDLIKAGEPVHIYLLDKDIFEKALYNTATAFIGTKDLEAYQEGTQKEITDTGEIITSVFFQETMTIKDDLISTEEYVFDSVDELSKYLLFGTLKEQDKYRIKNGENLDTIADDHNLNIEELLIANPQYVSSNVLLTEGEELNIGLISPLINVVYKKTVVDDIDVQYKTEYVDDKKKFNDYQEVKTQGENGKTRITQDIKYINGEIQSLNISKREVLKEPINEVIVRGTKQLNGGYYYYENLQGNSEWSWPTISPFIITSKFKWRWGRQHQGIDISGCGYGSPIYAVKGGTVFKINTNASANEGLCVYIDHGNGIITQYMHLSKILVSEGQSVSREQKIGLMGSSGASTGTHLHLGVWVNGRPYQGGAAVDPCSTIFQC